MEDGLLRVYSFQSEQAIFITASFKIINTDLRDSKRKGQQQMIIWNQTSSMFKFLSLFPVLLWKAHGRKWKLVMLQPSHLHSALRGAVHLQCTPLLMPRWWVKNQRLRGLQGLPKVVGPKRESVTLNPTFFSLCHMWNYICSYQNIFRIMTITDWQSI